MIKKGISHLNSNFNSMWLFFEIHIRLRKNFRLVYAHCVNYYKSIQIKNMGKNIKNHLE